MTALAMLLEDAHHLVAERRRLRRSGVADGAFRRMSQDEIANEAECLLAAMDGLEIQFLLNPRFDLERSFRKYVQNLESRLASGRAGNRNDVAGVVARS